MKRITLLLLTALSALFVYADDELTGKVTEQTKATEELATGQWYSLYNGSAFLKDNGDGTLGTSSTPAGRLSSDYKGVFIQLESAGDGTFYLKTYLGNYIGSLSSGATTTTGSTKAAYTVTQTDDGWAFGNNGLYLDSSLSGSSSAASWTAYQLTFCSESELTVSQRLTFHKNLYNSGDPIPFRLNCRRNTARYLTSSASGSASGAALISSGTDLSQIWLVTKSGDGYTYMNAETGEFLTSSYASPGSETTLYMQQSPNVDTDLYYNISSASDFSGSSCLNLGNDGSTLYEWSYSGDAGCDWAMQYVYEVSLDEILEHLDESNIYASEVEEGVYYRIISDAYSLAMTEANNEVKCLTTDESNIAQYWTLEKNGSGWNFKNVLTGNYIQVQNSTSNTYKTASNPYAFYIADAGDTWKNTFTFANTNGGSVGMHCASSQGYYVVNWSTSADASKWLFLETELNEDDILAAQEAQQKFEDMKSNLSSIQTSLNNLFSDKACTTLKSDIASLTDDELAANADYASLPEMIQETVLKVKNNTWTLPTNTSTVTDSYEKFFRIADYKVYSHYTQMAYSEQGQSNCFGKLSGPTGIFVNTGDVLCIYVDEDASSDCTLQVELVSTEGVPGGHQTGATTDLTAGLNLIQASEQDMVYIFYQLNNTSKYIADYPDIKIHIEGGTLNGYFDATRGMTNQDWSNLKNHDLLNVCPVINLKTDHLVFAMDADLVLSAITAAHKSTGDVQEDVEKLLRIWDMIPANEESYQGLDDFDGRFRNVWNCFSVNYNYMYATSYGTYYENSTLASVMNYYSMTHQGEGNGGGSLWGPSHEMGHNHQNLINLVGTTESSNNLFSNINFFEQGVSVTRGPSAQANFDNYLAAGSSWLDRDIWTTTRMFMQLYLYFHVMENDTTFLPNFFKALRKSPMSKSSTMSGATDYLKFAQTASEVAQSDLSEFFEAYGMFVPVENYFVDDYSQYYVTTKASEILTAKKAMQKYEKKLGNIMFIDDHIAKKKAVADNKFEAVPASDGYKVNCDTGTYYEVGKSGDCGDYEDYDGHTEYDVTNDYYSLNSVTSPSTISFKGTGYVGHKVYDLEGNLIWACNMKSATIPTAIRSLFPDNVVVVAAEENMSDVPCPFYMSGSSSYNVYGVQVTFPDSVSNKWWANGNIDEYLPTNAIGVVISNNAPEALTSSTNVVDEDGTAQSIVIDGDVACHVPQTINAAQLSFTKSGSGFQALRLPFTMHNANTIENGEYVYETYVSAGDPVVENGAVDISLTNATLKAGDFEETQSGYVLSSDGSAVVAAEGISPFVYVFDSAFEIGNLDSVNEILSAPNADENSVYDLSGRRLSKVTRQGIYIVNGKKMLLK